MSVNAFAAGFAAAGYHALAYDHRNFGTSEGEPRYSFDQWSQVRGYIDAISHALTHNDIDTQEVIVWGESMGGANVQYVGAFDSRVAGVIANLALLFNVILITTILVSAGAAMTLPGMAGLILTIGMAVDANVLIFERIREEIRAGRTPRASVEAGDSRLLPCFRICGCWLPAASTSCISIARRWRVFCRWDGRWCSVRDGRERALWSRFMAVVSPSTVTAPVLSACFSCAAYCRYFTTSWRSTRSKAHV